MVGVAVYLLTPRAAPVVLAQPPRLVDARPGERIVWRAGARNQALLMIGAIGAVVGAALLPTRWSTPLGYHR